MKKILLIILITFLTKAKAQITFEFALDSASAINNTIGGIYCQDELMVVNFELLGDEYVKINRHGRYISIYNMNHALAKTISFAGFQSGISNNYPGILYLSQSLFNTDSKIEFIYSTQPTSSSYYTGIYNEDGTLLFSDTGWAAVYQTIPMQQYPIYNTSDGTKMILSYTNGQAKVFDLGGTLTTAIDRVNPHINTGLGNAYPNPTVNSTTIPYTLPGGSNQGEVVFYNTQGVEVKRFKVDNTFNSLLVSTSDISAGTYYYQLQINGSASAAKKMVVIK